LTKILEKASQLAGFFFVLKVWDMFFISLPLHTKISPGWHSRISHIASNVENRMAFAFAGFQYG
jgi:hypothetical protein